MPENLYKSSNNKVFAGVCGGIAEYFKVDATLIRLAWALAFFVGGSGFVLYILAMIIMPEDPKIMKSNPVKENEPVDRESVPEHIPETKQVSKPPEGEEKRRQILGLILVAVGGYFLLQRFFPFFHFGNWWPLILIAIGGFILLQGRGGSR